MSQERLLGNLEARVSNIEKSVVKLEESSEKILDKLEIISAKNHRSKGFFAGVAAVFSIVISGATFLYHNLRG